MRPRARRSWPRNSKKDCALQSSPTPECQALPTQDFGSHRLQLGGEFPSYRFQDRQLLPMERERHPELALDLGHAAYVIDMGVRIDDRADGQLELSGPRQDSLRVVARVDGNGTVWVRPSGGQGSHQLRAMAEANALAILADGEGVDAGQPVRVLLIDPDALLGTEVPA